MTDKLTVSQQRLQYKVFSNVSMKLDKLTSALSTTNILHSHFPGPLEAAQCFVETGCSHAPDGTVFPSASLFPEFGWLHQPQVPKSAPLSPH